MIFRGDAPTNGGYVFGGVSEDCVVHVRRGSTGWGVEIPGIWNGLRIEYMANVEVDLGGGKSVAVPQTWIDEHPSIVAAVGGDTTAALNATASNGRLSVVEC